MPRTTLPLIDLAASLAGDPQALREAAAQLDAACRQHGFFYVSGHGVPLALTSHLFMLSRKLFDLPDAVKQRWHIERSGIQRGFDPIGWQALDAAHGADLKESFYLGVDRGPDDPLVQAGVPREGPNQWPDEALLPGFRATTQAYAAAMQRTARHLMGLMALALNLPRHHFEPCLRHPQPVLRLLHYPPPVHGEATAGIGCGAHTDWGALTLLAQDRTGGLQVQAGETDWLDVAPVAGTLVVNLGDLMQRWTNDTYRSTRHRVLSRPGQADRYSLAYFFEVDHDAVVSPLPTCVDAARPARYAPLVASQHIAAMYRRTTLAAAAHGKNP